MSDNEPGREDLAGDTAAQSNTTASTGETATEQPRPAPRPAATPAATDQAAPKATAPGRPDAPEAATSTTAEDTPGDDAEPGDVDNAATERTDTGGKAKAAPSAEPTATDTPGPQGDHAEADNPQDADADRADSRATAGASTSAGAEDAEGADVASEGAKEAEGAAPGDAAPGETDAGETGAGETGARDAGAGGSGAGDSGSGGVDSDGGSAKGGKPRRSRRRRVLRWTAVGMLAVVLVGGGGAAWLYHDIVGGIDQKHVGGRLGPDRPKKLNKSLNILLLGSDTRAGENSEYADGVTGARSDTTILLHLSPNRDQAVGISFPRDSMVKMPKCEKEGGGTVPAQFGMLNSAFAFGGPTCTWKTLEGLTGIHIDHFVQIDFSGFKRMVDALGGVEICVDRPVNDPRAQLYLKAGKQTVKGTQALGYVRARYSLGNGSDLERIQRQQKFMAAVVDKATSGSMLTDPAKTYKFLKAATKSMTTDDDLNLATMKKIADGLKGMDAGQVRFVTVPVERYAPDPNRVQWNRERAKALFEAVRRDDDLPAEPPAPAPSQQALPAPGQVNVTVVAAGAPKKAVDNAVRQLRERGFKVAKTVGKASAAGDTRLVYAPSAEAQASVLARALPDAVLTADGRAPAGGVRLVLGKSGARFTPPAINKIGGGVKAGRKNPCA
jgi:LCP family protein required for cell wall assembly